MSATIACMLQLPRWALIGFAVGAFAPAAFANHIPGATYTGTGHIYGGVAFVAWVGGSTVTSFHVTNVPGNLCNFEDTTFTGNFSITSQHTFSGGSGGSSFTGGFPSFQAAEGTVQLSNGYCQSAVLNWNATT